MVPDNLKSAVTKADRYAPGITFSYQQMATHYQCAIIPARPYRPKDKAKAEVAVLIVERWIMARLRHHTFFSLAALNQAIAELLEQLNQRAFKKLPGSRRTLFEQIDQPALRPLPSDAYQYVETRRARVHIDYHIEYDKHYYSVPHHLVKQEVEVQASQSTVSIYRDAVRVASHARSMRRGGFTTLAEHMPTAHRFVNDWSPERFIGWANEVGTPCSEVVQRLLERKRHPEQNYRSVLALMSNAKRYGRERLNNACLRALQINSPSRSSIESILKQGLDLVALEQSDEAQLDLDQHENVRGALYYH